ncbi:acetyl-CoA synthetase-like protein [Aspergillus saccharolyticus JOP 1030-1]|uniref:Acetyl-CoA synthetase-like protein n=1 Tax=Aspergillus saccharolyticus JOP 1030-1 TaxID=1450539 RepID=A0A318YYN6_9EURO|nr:acetyl-CoA synthetase-like protein [Aspergillus saccharolyticus JOP 1030-1]PYH40075.1 acetyl-CoA synthetase-like protein [Aspergillus saccharolyticus JOP 1030-1]
MLQIVPGAFDAALCRFPTEGLQRNAPGFKSIPVRASACSTEALLEAWTVVLRYYTGSDLLSFGLADSTVADARWFAVCHGEIPVDAALEQLQPSVQQPSEDASTTQSFAEWAALSTSFNTLVWKSAHADQPHLSELDTTHFSLILSVLDLTEELRVTLHYAAQAIGDSIAAAVADAVARATEAIRDAPHTTVGEVDLFGPTSWARLQELNATVSPTIEACLHELIDETAKLYPDRTALECWDGSVSYSELVEYTSRLGRFLISQDVGPEVFVPVCFDKSLWAVVSMLGVLKAGGAFVCIDPAQPTERLKTIISEVEANLTLTSPGYVEMVSPNVSQVIAVDRDFIQSLPPCLDFPKRASPSDAIFAIFTSGSTGKPKGIVHEHRAVCSSINAHSERLNIDSTTRTFQFAAYTFIVNTFELFTPLVKGGCVCVPSKEDRLGRTTAAMRELSANWFCTTPSFLRSIKPEDVPDIKTLLLAGEPVQQDNLDTWRSRVRMLNMYGASEASVCVTGELSGPVERSTIGHGTGVAAWVADINDHDRLAPMGATGELVVEGPVLARGYIHQPEKTASVFISRTPWLRDIRGETSSARAYKTGDLVRLGSNGQINLVGRKDMQVKLRGQRIELEEVEFHLRQALPRGTEAAVGLVKPVDQQDRPMLVAFVALRKGFDGEFQHPDPESAEDLEALTQNWRRKLSAAVPTYMIPSTMVKLNHMPLSPSGKTNRKAISDFASQLTVAQLTGATKKDHREPATATGVALRKIWAEVLQIEEESISAGDDFLQLGGNSIDAMKLVNLCVSGNLGLSVADVFTHPNLDDMAKASKMLDSLKPFEDIPFSLLHSSEDLDRVLHAAAEQCRVNKSAVEDLYPCTAMQEGLMALSDSRDGVYMAQHTLALGPSIDLERFKQACQDVVTAHPILRTHIVYRQQSVSLQAVIQKAIDWRTGESLEEYLDNDKRQPMGAGDALTRYGLAPRESGWTFIWTAHHAVYDAWTLDLVFERIDKAYKGQQPTRDTTFKAFMNHVVHTDTNASKEFWEQYLAGAVRNEFPCTVSTAKQPVSDSTAVYEMVLPRTDSLPGITMASMIRAAWGILIGSHSESEDVVFGTIVSGRNAPVPDIDRLVGPGIAAVPVRVKVPSDPTTTVREFVGNLQAEAAKMIAFEQLGLQNIGRLNSEAASACDFQTLLVVQPAKDKPTVKEPDLTAVSDADANFGTYALTLECTLQANGLKCAAHFDSSLIAADYVQRILAQLEHLLQQFCTATTDTKLEDLTFISAKDEESIREWNQQIPAPVHKTIHQLIEERIAEHPSKEAVCSWDGSFSYADLHSHSARLAHHLAELDVQPEDFVPCCFEKSRWPVAAMLGVMRAGGAFLNIDPSQPKSRIQLMITKLKAKTVVCSPEQHELCLSLSSDLNVVVLSAETPTDPATRGLPPTSVGPENAAYVIFTSGSTGEPKGTVIQHGAYASASTTHASTMLMDETTRALQFASFTFDASLVEILTTLVVGGCVCVASEEQRKRDVTEAIRETNCNWAALTPSFVNLLNPDDVPSLKVLVLAGEAMSQSHIETWAHRLRLVNAYGPSECCVCSTSNWEITSASSPRNIGRACSGATWVVMPNNHHRLVPVGSVGELVMEGWNMGRGYLAEPAKTQAAFVENPRWLNKRDTTRPPVVYKTGDLVRYNSDGTLSFQRRKDTQVKLRGQRIELGEIEYRIKQSLPNKPDAIVDILCPKDASSQPRLVAFLPVPIEEVSSSTTIVPPPSNRHLAAVSGLEDRLADFLPMHMIPSAYLPVNYIPKLPSGKADRKTLIRCGSEMTQRQMAEYTGATEALRPPTTETQLALQQLWAEVLKTSATQISLNDNFLRLGGDSITAMRLASAARAQGIPLSTATVFQHPTLEAMSAVAETLSHQQRPLTFEPFSTLKSFTKDQLLNEIVLPQVDSPASNIEDVLEVTDFQSLAIGGGLNKTRGWSNYLVFDFSGPIDLRRLQTACEELLRKHAILRTVFVKAESQLWQVVLRSVVPEYTFHIQDEQDPSEALVRKDLARPPRLGEPIVRFMVIKNGAIRHRLIMRISHGQYDGSSMPLLMQDLRKAYRGECLQKRPQFADFVRMQLLANEGAEAFHKQMLAGSTMTAVVEHTKPSITNVLNTMIAAMVPLVAYKDHGITAATVIKAAWALVLGEMATTSDVVYGHMVSGRNLGLDHVESVMGPCLNIVPVRADIKAVGTVLELLQMIQQQQTDTIPHEGLGFQHIIEQCTDWPSATRFSSVFQYQEFGAEEDPTQPVSIEGSLKCAPGFICPAPDACDVSILATPVGSQVRIEMIFSSHTMSQSFAEATLKKLCAKVETIAQQDVNTPLPSAEQLASRQAVLPLPAPGKNVANGLVEGVVEQMINGINAMGEMSGMNGTMEGEEEEKKKKKEGGGQAADHEINLLASVPIN